jgi:membrane-associated protease RseP (regulator of RpoE activity)
VIFVLFVVKKYGFDLSGSRIIFYVCFDAIFSPRKHEIIMSQLSFLFSMLWKILFITFFFGFCIFIHEFGHLLAALWRGLHVEKFSIGFGKKIWGFTIRGVEYVISWLPFGGYVMLPQLDPSDSPTTSSGEKLPLCPPQDRIIAAFAGPFFNVIFGFLLASVMWAVGVWEAPPAPSCILTQVPQILPVFKDGLKLTDKVIAVNGQETDGYWDEVSAEIPAGSEKLQLTIFRSGEKIELDYEPEINPEWEAGLRPGFRIIAVNGKSFDRGVEEMTTEYVFTKEASVRLTVIDNQNQQQEIRYQPAPNPLMEHLAFPFFQASNPVSIGEILPDSVAAQAGLKKGDQLLELNGTAITTAAAFAETLRKMTVEQTFSLKVSRQEQEILFENLKIPAGQPAGAAALGLAFNVRAARILAGMPASQAGIQAGDSLVALNGQDITDIEMFINSIRKSEGRPVDILVFGNNELRKLSMTPTLNQQDGKSVYQVGIQLSGTAPKIIGHPSPWRQFTNVVDQTTRTLGLLFSPLTRKIKSIGSDQKPEVPRTSIQVKHMSGPLGIIMMLWYKLKLEGLRGGLSFIILITFSLAMINLLPLPVLDGGHIVYALLELIFRRRLPVKVIAVLQNTFAVLLIALMLYITAFDGKRLVQRLSFGLLNENNASQTEATAEPEAEPEPESSGEQDEQP